MTNEPQVQDHTQRAHSSVVGGSSAGNKILDKLVTMDLTEVHRRLAYNPLTGVFTWKIRVSPRGGPGDVAGYVRKDAQSKYRVIIINYQPFLAQRLAWAMHYGEWPALFVDHENRDTTDNRIANLRLATHGMNQWNQRRRKKTGLKGASWCKKRLRWHSSIKARNQHYNLGYFDTEEEAHAAYCAAAVKHFGEYARFE